MRAHPSPCNELLRERPRFGVVVESPVVPIRKSRVARSWLVSARTTQERTSHRRDRRGLSVEGLGPDDPSLKDRWRTARRSGRSTHGNGPFAPRCGAAARAISSAMSTDTASEAVEVILRDGTAVEVRATSEADRERVVALLRSLSLSSRALRFGSAAVGLEAAAIASLRQPGLLALTLEGAPVGQIWYTPAGDRHADLAIVVADAYQGRGLGTALLHAAARQARAAGIHTLEAFVLPQNARMQHMLQGCGLPLRTRADFAGTTVEISTDRPVPSAA
jgi:GNAT superfamily N-acetyltransferase